MASNILGGARAPEVSLSPPPGALVLGRVAGALGRSARKATVLKVTSREATLVASVARSACFATKAKKHRRLAPRALYAA